MVKVEFEKYFMQHNGHGNGLIIKGGVRKGKTTLLSLICKILLEKTNFVIVSNVRFSDSVYSKYQDRIFYINSLRQYLEFIVNIEYENPILLILDDAQSKNEMTSKGVMSKGGKSLSSFLIFIGKLRTSYIYVAHQSYIPKSLIEGFEPLFIYKCNRQQFVISTNFYERDTDSYQDNDCVIVNMPSYLDFDKYYIPILSTAFTDFKFDVDLDLLYNDLTQFEIGEKTKECIARFLSNSENYKSSEYDELKNLSYEKIYMALCLKHGYIIPTKEKLRDLINSNMIHTAKRKLKKVGLK